MRTLTLSRLHGLFNVFGGVWPLLHMRSFEAVFGKKTDRWLVRTVAGLLVTNGLTQLRSSTAPASLTQSRRIGIGTAAVLATIDVTYAPRGRISRMYLADAVLELTWVLLWTRSKKLGKAPTSLVLVSRSLT